MRGRVYLGFPGVGGTLISGTAEYIRIKPQPSALEAVHDPRLEDVAAHLTGRGFAVQPGLGKRQRHPSYPEVTPSHRDVRRALARPADSS